MILIYKLIDLCEVNKALLKSNEILAVVIQLSDNETETQSHWKSNVVGINKNNKETILMIYTLQKSNQELEFFETAS